jgi:hypothetical protein
MSTPTAQAAEASQALWRLVVDELVDRASGNEATAAKDLMHVYFKGKDTKDIVERKQISNLSNVVAETRSMPVVIDFVRYQMGRQNTGPRWRARAGDISFGDAVIAHIEELKEGAQAIVNEAKAQKLACPNEAREVQAVWRQLVRRYCTYLEHSFVYEDANRPDAKANLGRKER